MEADKKSVCIYYVSARTIHLLDQHLLKISLDTYFIPRKLHLIIRIQTIINFCATFNISLFFRYNLTCCFHSSAFFNRSASCSRLTCFTRSSLSFKMLFNSDRPEKVTKCYNVLLTWFFNKEMFLISLFKQLYYKHEQAQNNFVRHNDIYKCFQFLYFFVT